MGKSITVETYIEAPIEKIWEYWTEPVHIQRWCHASDDWCAPRALNDLVVGGKFTTRMESTDGTIGFDFEGTYTDVKKNEKIEYVMADGRKVQIVFVKHDNGYKIIETFDPENENPPEMQQAGWQSILDNFKLYISTS